MESNEIREQLRLAERAAAAPYVDYPKDPWWHMPLLSLTSPIFAYMLYTMLHGTTTSRSTISFPAVASLGIALIIILHQRKRRGALPSGGKAPAELTRVLRWYAVGGITLAVSVIALALTTPLYVSVPVAWVLSLGGIYWFGRAYERAAEQVRERLA